MRIQELLNEFAPHNGNDDDREPDEEHILRQLAAQWWNGDEQQMNRVERTLAAMGWEIGEDESGDDDAGVFLVRAGDINGDSYIAYNHSDLTLDESTVNEALATGQILDLRANYPQYTKILGRVDSIEGSKVTLTIIAAEPGMSVKRVPLQPGDSLRVASNYIRRAPTVLQSSVDEVVQPELVDQKKFHHEYHDAQGLLWSAVSTGEFDLVVDVRDHNHSIIAYATFEVNPDENSISSSDTWVSDRYRRQGIATKMYNWAQELGNTVVKSSTLLPKGKRFWAARDKSDATVAV
jgi:predicted GNAT family acetyltransferase